MDERRIEQLDAEVPELWGNGQVAALLGVQPSNLDRIRDLPAAAQELPSGRLWRVDVIRDFAKKRKRKAKTKTTTTGGKKDDGS